MTKVKNLILISMLMGMTSAANAANDKLPNGKPFVLLNEQILEVENSVQALEHRYDAIIADIYSSIEGLEGKVSAINLKITDLEEVDTQLQEEITQTISELESQGADISSLFEHYQALKAQLEALEASAATNSQLEALEAEIETVKGSIAGVSSEVVSLVSDVEVNTELIALLQQDIENLKVMMENAIPQGECPQGQFLVALHDNGSIVCSSSDASASPQVMTLVSSGIALDKNGLHSYALNCQPSQQIISGGYRIEGSQEGFSVLESFPWNNGWRVTIKANNSWKGGNLYVHAMCIGS